jgi:hypothetical protein
MAPYLAERLLEQSGIELVEREDVLPEVRKLVAQAEADTRAKRAIAARALASNKAAAFALLAAGYSVYDAAAVLSDAPAGMIDGWVDEAATAEFAERKRVIKGRSKAAKAARDALPLTHKEKRENFMAQLRKHGQRKTPRCGRAQAVRIGCKGGPYVRQYSELSECAAELEPLKRAVAATSTMSSRASRKNSALETRRCFSVSARPLLRACLPMEEGVQ